MIVVLHFLQAVSRYGSAGNAKLLVLPVTFFLSEIDDTEQCNMLLFLLYFLLNIQCFWIFLEKLSVAQGPLSINRERGVLLHARGWIHHFGPMWLASNAAPCWQREKSAHTFTARSKTRDPSKFRIRDPNIKTLKIHNLLSISQTIRDPPLLQNPRIRSDF